MRSFSQSRFSASQFQAEDINPSAYIVNLADCMLVLACGFMVAMITYWNLDISSTTELENTELEEVDPSVIDEDEIGSGGTSYIERGTVYQDPSTGKLYMVEPTGDDVSGTDTSDTSSSANSTDGGTTNSASSASTVDTSSSTSASTTDSANSTNSTSTDTDSVRYLKSTDE